MPKPWIKNSKILCIKLGLKNLLLLKMCYFISKSRFLSCKIKLNECFANKLKKDVNLKLHIKFIELNEEL
jgi:hypothetical protein